jgi:hypothetical protein
MDARSIAALIDRAIWGIFFSASWLALLLSFLKMKIVSDTRSPKKKKNPLQLMLLGFFRFMAGPALELFKNEDCS